jgi:hypothetical protein
LREREDAYGRRVLDYFERGEGLEIVERDDGFINSSGGPAAYVAPFPALAQGGARGATAGERARARRRCGALRAGPEREWPSISTEAYWSDQ